jgi:mono/diheme cytochrome c family protein
MGRRTAVLLVTTALLGACRRDMQEQPKYKPLRASAFFDDGRASRPLVPDTVARGHLETSTVELTGKSGADWVREAPVPRTQAVLARGRERYDIYCAPCHDRVGTGGGMIVLRGFRRPPSFHSERLRSAPDGYLFDVITHGFGVMPSYAAQVPVEDRWAIVRYLRALQRSQWATLADVPADERARLEGAPP